MMLGLFPPSSRVTFFRLLAAAASMILRPTSVEPVKATFSMCGCLEMATPAVDPSPLTMLTTPGGKPASSIRVHMRNAVKGVNSDGFNTTVFPVANAGPSFQAIIANGKFQGII